MNEGRSLTVDVLSLVAIDLSDLELAVGGKGSAVTAGKVVDDNPEDLVARDALESRLRTEVAASIEEVRADPSNVISSEDMYTFLSGLKGKYHTKQAS